MQQIKAQYRIIHDVLHSKHNSVTLGRKQYEILQDNQGRRYVDYDNIRFLQHPVGTVIYGRRAFRREKITWCIPHDHAQDYFVIDAHSLIQPLNNATIGVDISKLKNKQDAIIGQPAQAAKAGRSRKKLGGK